MKEKIDKLQSLYNTFKEEKGIKKKEYLMRKKV
jgi:hypothetical protein